MNEDNSLYGLRELRKVTAQREARGEVLWTEHLDETVRNKLGYALADLRLGAANYQRNMGIVLDDVAKQLGLSPNKFDYDEYYEPSECIFDCITDQSNHSSLIFSIVEGIYQKLSVTHGPNVQAVRSDFTAEVQLVLEDHRIAFDFVEGRIIPRGEQVMHAKIVVPTISLLSGRSEFEESERYYCAAIKSIQSQRYDDAVNDASTALEAVFKALDFGGNALGARAKKAKNAGTINSYDLKYIDWIAADRAAKGDSHPGNISTREDAWLAVHVVGAFILRLASGVGR